MNISRAVFHLAYSSLRMWGKEQAVSQRSATGAKLVHVTFNLQMSGKDWGIW